MSPDSQPQVIQTEANAPASAMSDVFVPAAQCFAAGIGAGLVAGIIVNHLGYAPADCIKWGLTAAGIVCGLALFWRFFWSVTHEDWEWEKMLLTIDNLEDQVQALNLQLSTVSRDRDDYRNQAEMQAALRNTTKNYTAAKSELDPVRQNAKKMTDFWLQYATHPSRRKMEELDMSQGAYAEALAYLHSKGAIVTNGSQVSWKINTAEQADMVLG